MNYLRPIHDNLCIPPKHNGFHLLPYLPIQPKCSALGEQERKESLRQNSVKITINNGVHALRAASTNVLDPMRKSKGAGWVRRRKCWYSTHGTILRAYHEAFTIHRYRKECPRRRRKSSRNPTSSEESKNNLNFVHKAEGEEKKRGCHN